MMTNVGQLPHYDFNFQGRMLIVYIGHPHVSYLLPYFIIAMSFLYKTHKTILGWMLIVYIGHPQVPYPLPYLIVAISFCTRHRKPSINGFHDKVGVWRGTWLKYQMSGTLICTRIMKPWTLICTHTSVTSDMKHKCNKCNKW